MLACSWLAEITVVLRGEPFQCTTEEVTKFEPFTVSVKALPPVGHEVGEVEVSVGTGLLVCGAEMVNVALPEVPPPGVGLNTVTVRLPWLAMSLAEMLAVSCVADTKVVVRFEPFQRTVEAATKLVPLTVSVKAGPPAGVVFGASEPTVGTGFDAALMVNVRLPEVPPPGL